MNDQVSDTLALPYQYDYYCGQGRQMKDLHMHSYYEISIVVQGNIDIIFEDAIYTVAGCNILVYPPYTLHSIVADSREIYERHNLYLCADFLFSLLNRDKMQENFEKISSIIPVSSEQIQKQVGLLKLFQQEPDQVNKKLFLTILLNDLCGYSLKETIRECRPQDSYIHDILNYIYRNYQNKLVAEEIAVRFSVSRTKLFVDFKKAVGIPLNQYITQVRLSRAQQLLTSGRTVEETAQECGFLSSCNFYRVFKKHYQDTPRNRLHRTGDFSPR